MCVIRVLKWRKTLKIRLKGHRKELKTIKEALIKTEKELMFYKEALKSLPNPLFIKDESTKFVFFNQSYEEMFGMNETSFLGKRVYDLEYLPREDRQRYQQEDEKMIHERSVIHYESKFLCADGELREAFYWSRGFHVSATHQKGLIGEIVDVSREKELQKELAISLEHLKKANAEIEKAARTDALTGADNRNVLIEQLPRLIAIANRHKVPFSILLIDVDDFKSINDERGHGVGDQVLVEIVKLFKGFCRAEDFIIRYGGEEFLVILPVTYYDQAREFGSKVCHYIENNIILDNNTSVTVSIGAAEFNPLESMEELLSRADTSLYKAKRGGKNRVC